MSSSGKSVPSDTMERTVHCQEFYRSLYPEFDVSAHHYCYDRFSLPDDLDGESSVGQSVLKWFYIQNTLENGEISDLETEGNFKDGLSLIIRLDDMIY